MQRYGSAGYRKCVGSVGKSFGVLFAVIVVAAVVLLEGCGAGGSSFPADRSVIYIAKDGGLYTALCGVYDAEKDYYSEEELKARVEEEVAAYNAEYPAGAQQEEAVTVEDVRLGNGSANVVLRYSDAESLIRFTEASQDVENHTEKLSVTMIGEGLPAVPGEEEAWVDAKRNDPVTPEQIRRRTDLHLVAVAGPVTVRTERRILYYSGAVNLLDKFTAQVADGDAYIVYK